MALDISIGTDYRIRSDQRNFIVDKVSLVRSKDDNTISEVWGTQNKYPGTLEQACEIVLKDSMLNSDAKELKQLIAEVKETKELIRESVGDLMVFD